MKRVRVRRSWSEFLVHFWSQVEKTDGCWLWHGSTLTTSEGVVLPRCWPPTNKLGISSYAQRMSYELEYGAFPNHLCVCHHCDNHLCVRPDHLFLGTHRDNMNDMAIKQRAASREHNGASKLRTGDVLKIRHLWNSGFTNKSAISRQFGVSHTLVRFIVNRQYWRSVA